MPGATQVYPCPVGLWYLPYRHQRLVECGLLFWSLGCVDRDGSTADWGAEAVEWGEMSYGPWGIDGFEAIRRGWSLARVDGC